MIREWRQRFTPSHRDPTTIADLVCVTPNAALAISGHYFDPCEDVPDQCAPPWPNAWLQWSEDGARFAALVQSANVAKLSDALQSTDPGEPLRFPNGTGVVIHVASIVGMDGRFVVPGCFFVPIDASGRCLLKARELMGPEHPYRVDGDLADGGNPGAALLHIQNVVLATFALAHCRNVEVVEEKPDLPRAERRRLERDGLPMTKWRSLRIRPGMSSRVTKADTDPESVNRALHICRGHFATYSEDRPLFGKYAGRFFVPMHTRGNAVNGRVEKEYVA